MLDRGADGGMMFAHLEKPKIHNWVQIFKKNKEVWKRAMEEAKVLVGLQCRLGKPQNGGEGEHEVKLFASQQNKEIRI